MLDRLFNGLNNPFVRKAPTLTAAAAALFVLLLPAPSEARSKHHRRASWRTLPHAVKTPEIHTVAGPPAEVIVDEIEVVVTDESSPEAATPVPEAYNYPQPPCPAEDPVIEAHVHVADADAPEKPESEILPREESPRISRIARASSEPVMRP